jgi:hypothetical protein
MSARGSTLQEIRTIFAGEYTTTETMIEWIPEMMANLHTRAVATMCSDVLREIRRTMPLTNVDMMEFRAGEQVYMSTAWDAKAALMKAGILVQNNTGDPWVLVGQVGRTTNATKTCNGCNFELSRAGVCVNCF